MKLSPEFLESLNLPDLDIVAYFLGRDAIYADKDFAIQDLSGKEITDLDAEIMLTMIAERNKTAL